MSGKIKIDRLNSDNKENAIKEFQQKKLDNMIHNNDKSKDYKIVSYLVEKDYWNINDKAKRSLSGELLAIEAIKDFNIYFNDGIWFMYVGGVYRQVTKEKISNLIHEKYLKGAIDKRPSWKTDYMDSLQNIAFIDKDKFEELFINKTRNIINLKNGFLKISLESGKYSFHKHEPELKTIIQLNVNYINKKNHPNWDKFLKTSLNTKEERMLLQEFTGYCLINYLAGGEGQIILCKHGEGGNGKGTIDRIIDEILGNINTYCIKVSNLTDQDKQDKFSGYQYKNKLLIYGTETNYVIKDMSVLKSLSGGDRQNFDVKGSMVTDGYTYNGKICISTNDKTKIYDTTKGTKRRLKFLKIDNDIKEIDVNLDEKLKQEKDSIFLWMLEGLQRLIKNNYNFTLPDSHYDLFKKYIEFSDNFISFIRSHIIEGNGIAKSTVFNLFKEEYGNKYTNKRDFFEKFEKALKNENYKTDIKHGRYDIPDINNDNDFPKYDRKTASTPGYSEIGYIEYKENENDIKTLFWSEFNTDILYSISIDFNNLDSFKEIDTCKKYFEMKNDRLIVFDINNYISKNKNAKKVIDIESKRVYEQIKLNRGAAFQSMIEKNEAKTSNDKNVDAGINNYDVVMDISKVNLNMTYPTKSVKKLYFDKNKLVLPECKAFENTNMIKSFYESLNLKPDMYFEQVKTILSNNNIESV